MAVIAIAGGTGPGLGRNVTLGCAANPNHKVIVLSRASSKVPEWLEKLEKVELRKVDYNSVDSLTDALKGVDTVLSTLLAHDSNEWISSQTNLVHASLAAGVRRFVPSEWGLGHRSAETVSMFNSMLPIREELRKAKAANPDFEWTAFSIGAFMNYLGEGSPHPDAKNGLGEEQTVVFDISKMTATIPLKKDGSVPELIMTELGDVARMASAVCELPHGQWKEYMGFIGDRMKLDEMIPLIEKIRGRKLKVDYLPFDVIIENGGKAENPLEKMWWEILAAQARHEQDEGVFDGDINDLVKFTPISYEGYLNKYWS